MKNRRAWTSLSLPTGKQIWQTRRTRGFRVLLPFVVSVVFVASTFGADWPMWRYDAERTACSPNALPEQLHLQWVRHLPMPQPAWPPDQDKLQFDLSYEPVVMGKTIFVPSMVRDHVTAYDTESGQQQWRFYTNGPVRFAPVAAHGKVYFVSDDGLLYCLNAKKGTLVWKFQGGPADKRLLGNQRLISVWPARGGPVLQDGKVYFAAGIWPFMGIFLYAMDAETGDIVWTNSGSGSTYLRQKHFSPAFAGVAPQGYIVATGNTLLVSGGRTVPAAYDRETGRFLHFTVGDGSFGKDNGGYEVYAKGNSFFNRGAMYQVADGKPLLRVPASVLTNDAIIGLSPTGTLVAHAMKLEKETFTGRKGRKQSRVILKKLWEATLEPALDRVFLKAGPRLYGSGPDGLISAAELPQTGRDSTVVWQARIDGDVWNMLAADNKLFVITRQGSIYCFGEKPNRTITHNLVLSDTPSTGENDQWQSMASSILKQTGATEGYGLVLGVGSGRLIAELLNQTKLHVIGLDPDTNKVETLRKRLDRAGIYGGRVAVHAGDIFSMALPPYLTDLIVSEDLNTSGPNWNVEFVKRVFRSLRPYGGVACFHLGSQADHKALAGLVEDAKLTNAEVVRSSPWTLLKRAGALPGSAEWTHQYADAANSVVSKDKSVKLPLGLLWFGGPSNAKILPRHGHGPSPQVIDGRLFIEGPDILRAVDVYTGRLLWERVLPRIGKYYDDTEHAPGANALGSNYVSTHDAIYVAYGKECLRLEPATGKTLSQFRLPITSGDKDPPEWGYINVWDDLLIAGARPMSFWEPDFEVLDFRSRDRKKNIKRIIDKMKAWKGFVPIPRVKGEDDFAFAVKNLNKMVVDPAMDTKIPDAVKTQWRSDDDRARQVEQIQKEIRSHLKSHPPSPQRDVRLITLNRKLLEHYYALPKVTGPAPGRYSHGSWFDRLASEQLVGMDRLSGKVLWTYKARHALRHNAIAAADGKIFLIDRLPSPVIERMKRRGQTQPGDARLVALDARTGAEIWSTSQNVFGTWLSYSEEYKILLQAGSHSRDRAIDEAKRGMVAYQGDDGQVIWESDATYGGPIMLHHDTIITQGKAFSLASGKAKTRQHPLTGETIPWGFTRNYGCNTAIASEHLLTFRSAAAGYFDLSCDGGTGNLGGFKSGCTSNLIAANGVLNAPDYTRTCICSYQLQTSLALVHEPDVETWTFNAFKAGKKPVRRIGINFGAPGDRVAENTTLWLDYPSAGGPSPDIPVRTTPAKPRWFRYHSSRMSGEGPSWVMASGATNLKNLTIALAEGREESHPYTIRLYFAEPEAIKSGHRVFDVAIQGKPALQAFDVVREAGAPCLGIVKEFKGIKVAENLIVKLTPSRASESTGPILCGLEVIAEGLGD